MPEIDARDAVEYATDTEWLKLYAVLLAGWLLSLVGEFVVGVFTLPGTGLVGGLLLLTGTAVVIVGLVAAAHKLLADSTGPAAASED